MEPFTVTCSTCESRIRVRNPDLIGQVATCPKCSSMILITPPATVLDSSGGRRTPMGQIEVVGRDGSAVDSMAVTKEGLADNLPRIAPENYRVSAETPSQPTDDDEYRLIESEDEQGLSAPPIQGGVTSGGLWHEDAAPHIPSAEWTSDSTHRTRQYLLIAFLGASGITLAGILFWGFLKWHSADRPSQVQSASNTPAPVTNIQSQPTGDSGPEAISNEPQVNIVSIPTPINPVEPSIAVPGPITVPDAATLEPSNGPSEQAVDATRAVAETPDNLDPLPANSVDAEPAPAPQLPKQLSAFAPMLNSEIQPQFPDAIEVLSEAPVTAEDLGLTASAGLPEIPPVDLSVQAQVPISGLIIGALPAAQFVSLWSNLSGIPTVVDLDTLAAAAIDRHQQLSLSLVQATSVGELVPQLGQSLGLRAEARDNRWLQLVAPAEAMEQKLPAEVSLQSLIVDATGEAWLVESLMQLFPELDVQWKPADGQLPRPLTADGRPLDPVQWFAVVKLIEGWRLATGQAHSLQQYTAQQLSADFFDSSEVTGLDTNLRHVSAQAHPVAQILPRICQEAGVDAWIDWANVGAVGLGPQSTAVFVTAERPLRRALADYATEFSLVVAIVDERSLWITSNQAYRATPQRYVIPSDGRSAEEWKTQLRPLTPTAVGANGVGSVVVVPTLDEKFVLVRCCRPLVSF